MRVRALRIGLYAVMPGATPRIGDTVIALPPTAIQSLAAERRYLPQGVPLVKRVAAISGDRICGTGDAVFINGRLAAKRLFRDSRGRPLPIWSGCRTLRAGAVFLLMTTVRDSFDGARNRLSGADLSSTAIKSCHSPTPTATSSTEYTQFETITISVADAKNGRAGSDHERPFPPTYFEA